MSARSCDIFVALSDATHAGHVIFGMNANRPGSEIQQVVYHPAADHPPDSKTECTYISVDQVAHTHAVMLSGPAWAEGALMGANENGVCIGNGLLSTKLNNPADMEEKLLGLDLVRLSLERAASAEEAMRVITCLLEKHGQGGPCYENLGPSAAAYHNSFLICDSREAWVLETAGTHWASQRISNGVRNISNHLTIRTQIDAMSEGLKEHAQSQGWWCPDDGPFDFAKSYSEHFRETDDEQGQGLLEKTAAEGKFGVQDMFKILRDEKSGICLTGSFVTVGSQVSVLPSAACNAPACHWFTATPNPRQSIFKPFVFCDNASIGEKAISPAYSDQDPAKVKPRFQREVDRRHELYREHEKLMVMLDKGEEKGQLILQQMQELEAYCVCDMDDVMAKYDINSAARLAQIFQHMVDLEINFYK